MRALLCGGGADACALPLTRLLHGPNCTLAHPARVCSWWLLCTGWHLHPDDGGWLALCASLTRVHAVDGALIGRW